jgi:tRNA-intron endonuclease
MLSVYKDLRDRGRRVRILEPMKFLVKDKSGHLRLVLILEEKNPVNINMLEQLVEEARRNNMLATLAIVSLQGELTYYEVTQADLRVA